MSLADGYGREMNAISAVGDQGRKRSCATRGCAEVFVPSRPNQVLHDPQCRSRHRYRNLVESKELLYEAVDELQGFCRRMLDDMQDSQTSEVTGTSAATGQWQETLEDLLDRTDRILAEVPLDREPDE